MSKSINKEQLQHLLSIMEANPAIACSFFKGSKDVLSRFWMNAEKDLNSLAPPKKCIAEWKKVWADQKKYVRHKAAQNLKEKKSTGGGPYRELKFSPTEQAIFDLVGMKVSVEGGSTKRFGLNSSKNKEDSTLTLEDDVDFLDDVVLDELEEPQEILENIPPTDMAAANDLPASTSLKMFQSVHKLDVQKEMVKNSSDALQAELEMQKELLETIKMIPINQKELEQNTKRVYRALDKTNEISQKHFKTMECHKREEIEELRRHNAFMEKQRVTEVEYKLEKYKLEMQQL